MAQPRPNKEAQYWYNAKVTGQYIGNALTDGTLTSQDARLAWIYYDMSSVMWRIKDYLDSVSDSAAPLFANYATQADDIYLTYLVPNYNAQGFRNFTDGFEQSWYRTAQTTKKTAAINLSIYAAYARDSTPISETVDWSLSRETTYAIRSYLSAERLGEAERARKDLLIQHSLGHYDQWFVSQTAAYVKTFMVGLWARGMIDVFNSPNASSTLRDTIKAAVMNAAEWLWANMWVASFGGFRYQSVTDPSGSTDPEKDLSMLVSPMYGWLWYQTGDITWQNRHHTIFDSAVTEFDQYGGITAGAYILQGKQFDQHYFWSMEGLDWATRDPIGSGSSGGGSGGSGGSGSGSGSGGGTGGSGGGGTGGGAGSGGGTGSGNGGIGGSGGFGNSPPRGLVQNPLAIVLPVRQESWRQHFERNSWDNIDEQVQAGYALMLQPTPDSATFEQVVDMGAEIPAGVVVTFSMVQETIDGTVSITPTLAYSTDNSSWTELDPGVTQYLSGAFRYVRLHLDAVAANDKSFARISQLRLKVAAKEIRDGGHGTAAAIDYTGEADPDLKGTLVEFNKSFIDIDSLQVTARYQSGLDDGGFAVAYWNFQDDPYPTGFRVFIVNSANGDILDGDFDWSCKGY